MRQSAYPRKEAFSPACVDRIASSSTQTAKFRHVRVANGSGLQRGGQSVAIELRIVSRTQHRTHVDHASHGVCLNKRTNSSVVRVEWPIASVTKDSGFDVFVQPSVHQ